MPTYMAPLVSLPTECAQSPPPRSMRTDAVGFSERASLRSTDAPTRRFERPDFRTHPNLGSRVRSGDPDATSGVPGTPVAASIPINWVPYLRIARLKGPNRARRPLAAFRSRVSRLSKMLIAFARIDSGPIRHFDSGRPHLSCGLSFVDRVFVFFGARGRPFDWHAAPLSLRRRLNGPCIRI